MNPETLEAIRIAEKHLAGESPDKREALAKDIVLAIIQHAHPIARDAIRSAFEKANA
jgi:hypothetical protein